MGSLWFKQVVFSSQTSSKYLFAVYVLCISLRARRYLNFQQHSKDKVVGTYHLKVICWWVSCRLKGKFTPLIQAIFIIFECLVKLWSNFHPIPFFFSNPIETSVLLVEGGPSQVLKPSSPAWLTTTHLGRASWSVEE